MSRMHHGRDCRSNPAQNVAAQSLTGHMSNSVEYIFKCLDHRTQSMWTCGRWLTVSLMLSVIGCHQTSESASIHRHLN